MVESVKGYNVCKILSIETRMLNKHTVVNGACQLFPPLFIFPKQAFYMKAMKAP